jgi:hypothetical protein
MRTVDFIDINAFIKAFALLFRQIFETCQKLRGKIFNIVRRVQKCAPIVFRVFKRLLGNRIAMFAKKHIGPMRLSSRIEIHKGMLANFARLLGEPGEGDQRGGIRNLRGFVQEYGGIFEPEDFLDAVIVVKPPNPDTRAIQQRKITVLAMLLKPHPGKTELHNLRKRAECDGSPRRIGVVT